jgi:cytochrome P450
MRRRVERDMTLSNGIKLKVGDRIAVDSHRMWDSSLHAQPERWDPYRFLAMRTADPAKENTAALLVTTSPDHLGFGHGRDACPGRFFAANEVKVAICHILLKYDWELVPGTDTKPVMMGLIASSSPTARINIRRQDNVELDIDSF